MTLAEQEGRATRQSWLQQRSRGARYALALGLNAVFVTAVIVVFAMLYQLGRRAKPPDGQPAPRIEQPKEQPRPRTPPAGRPAPAGETGPVPAPARNGRPTPTPAPAANPGVIMEAPTPIEPGAATPAPAGSSAPAAAADAESLGIAPEELERARLWAMAGQLAAELERTLPCSEFAVRPGPDGRPALRGTVATPADRAAAEARAAQSKVGAPTIELGLGCTIDLGGGYLAMGDARGSARALVEEDVSTTVRGLLLAASSCSVLGDVIDSQPAVKRQLADPGPPAIWVLQGGSLALCELRDGDWRRRTSGLKDRRAAAVMFSGDVLAAEARAAAEEDVSAFTPRVKPTPKPKVVEPEGASPAGSEAPAAPVAAGPASLTAAPVAVTPIAGPAPIPPAGVAIRPPGLYVTVAFSVDEGGKARDLVVLDASDFDVRIVSAAQRVVEQSIFARPSADQNGAYRGVYTVPFPASEALTAPGPFAGTSAAAAAPASLVGPSPPPESSRPIWVKDLTPLDLKAAYPRRALTRQREGEVSLLCIIEADGSLQCRVESENPGGWGFGAAAERLSGQLRAHPVLADGRPSAGTEVRLPFSFELPKE